jgi:hypothetical protein
LLASLVCYHPTLPNAATPETYVALEKTLLLRLTLSCMLATFPGVPVNMSVTLLSLVRLMAATAACTRSMLLTLNEATGLLKAAAI